MKIVFSGIQPSGNLHIGNYLGATRQHVDMQKNYECIYMLADLHALTTIRDPEKLKYYTREIAADYLALGINPEKTIFFKQSDIPEHTELTWIFDCITPFGLLQRAHAWKDAQEKGKKEMTVGLFNYPVLQAVDILLYKPNLIPVGKDQKQHIEMSRDIATTFNDLFGPTLPLPEAYIEEEVAVVPGTDGQKMSKSYGNVIEVFADEDILKKQIMSIITDSKSVEEPKDPKTCIPFLLYQHFVDEQEKKEAAQQLEKGGLGYGDLKKKLYDKIFSHFKEARQKKKELIKKPEKIDEILQQGAEKAKKIAQKTMAEIRKKIGLS